MGRDLDRIQDEKSKEVLENAVDNALYEAQKAGLRDEELQALAERLEKTRQEVLDNDGKS